MIMTVKPSALLIGDRLTLTDSDVYVTEVYTDDYGTWVAYSDGDEGYHDARVRIERETLI